MSIPNIPALMTRLETQISALKQHYAERLGEKIFIKTDRTLFSENYQSIAGFLQEIDTTLQRLQSVKFEQFEYVQLITERLIKQCALLADSAAQNMPQSTTRKKPTRQPTKVSHAVHKLPPRERLEKYYEARSQLQECYQQTKARAIAAEREEVKARYFTDKRDRLRNFLAIHHIIFINNKSILYIVLMLGCTSITKFKGFII